MWLLDFKLDFFNEANGNGVHFPPGTNLQQQQQQLQHQLQQNAAAAAAAAAAQQQQQQSATPETQGPVIVGSQAGNDENAFGEFHPL